MPFVTNYFGFYLDFNLLGLNLSEPSVILSMEKPSNLRDTLLLFGVRLTEWIFELALSSRPSADANCDDWSKTRESTRTFPIESSCIKFFFFFFPFLVLRNLFGLGEFECEDDGLMGFIFLKVAGL